MLFGLKIMAHTHCIIQNAKDKQVLSEDLDPNPLSFKKCSHTWRLEHIGRYLAGRMACIYWFISQKMIS